MGELNRINRTRVSDAPPPPPPKKAEPKPTARSKALEFAKEVPKPKPKPRSSETKKNPAAEQTKIPTEADLGRADLEEIRQREIQHFEDMAKVEQIKELLNRCS